MKFKIGSENLQQMRRRYKYSIEPQRNQSNQGVIYKTLDTRLSQYQKREWLVIIDDYKQQNGRSKVCFVPLWIYIQCYDISWKALVSCRWVLLS